MTESAINANVPEAQRLYLRGVAAARGGQKRVAAGLLTRSVQLDPRNESAWLWLSGVLEDPHQIAFCLQAVLRINPTDERALKGLRWLEERKLLHGEQKPTPAALASAISQPLPAAPTIATAEREERRDAAWWMRWRTRRREDTKLRLLVPVMLIVLLCSILLLHSSLAQANEQRQQAVFAAAMPKPTVVLPTLTVPLAPSPTTMASILDTDPATMRDAVSISYLSVVTPLRAQLRDAVDNYRSISGQPGATSVLLASSVGSLRDTVLRAQTTLQSLTPSTPLRGAHEEYLKGLELELQALNDLLEFYGSYRQELANRAAVRFQEANTHFERARLVFDQQPRRLESRGLTSPHTPR